MNRERICLLLVLYIFDGGSYEGWFCVVGNSIPKIKSYNWKIRVFRALVFPIKSKFVIQKSEIFPHISLPKILSHSLAFPPSLTTHHWCGCGRAGGFGRRWGDANSELGAAGCCWGDDEAMDEEEEAVGTAEEDMVVTCCCSCCWAAMAASREP